MNSITLCSYVSLILNKKSFHDLNIVDLFVTLLVNFKAFFENDFSLVDTSLQL